LDPSEGRVGHSTTRAGDRVDDREGFADRVKRRMGRQTSVHNPPMTSFRRPVALTASTNFLGLPSVDAGGIVGGHAGKYLSQLGGSCHRRPHWRD
jgi:hypothetical protein